jgi:polyribonucleotide nucleotidyltransferase
MHCEEVRVGEAVLTLETGRIARQAHGALVVRHGRSFVLATAVGEKGRDAGDFFPLTVEYRERLAAGGRIPGGYGRREGRITDREVLTSRLIDRTLRPLFPKGFRDEVQVLVTVFSADPESDLEGLGLIAAAGAVHLSDLPFNGPVAGLRLIRRETRFVPLPAPAERPLASLDLVVSTSREGLVMVEGEADRIGDEELIEALDVAGEHIGAVLDAFDRLREKAGRPKRAWTPPAPDAELLAAVRDVATDLIHAALAVDDKAGRRAALADAEALVIAEVGLGDPTREKAVAGLYEAEVKHIARLRILDGKRIGGRPLDAVRPIECEVGLLQSCHGSALFTRGETQAIVSATLGTRRDQQDVETVQGMQQERFLLHYNFPPYSVGEVRAVKGPGRREIGHGNLALRALVPVLPDAKAWPYTMRVVSDITESNGSSSMATVCGGCLALVDAGVPLKEPVAGIAMGLIGEGGRTAVLSDILGDEDHLGDMDFKVAGTAQGITAVQMDNKLGSLPRDVLARALAQAGEGRRHILAIMHRALAAVGAESASARHAYLRVNPARIGAIIGSGGSNIRELQESTRTRIDVQDDGSVLIFGADERGTREAVKRIQKVALELRKDGLYVGEVVSVKEFGCFVRIADHEGLVHVSELDRQRVESVESVVRPGEEILVRVLGVDERGRLKLSRKAALGESKLDALNA